MKYPAKVRDELLRELLLAFDRVRIRMSMYLADDLDTIGRLQRPQVFDLAEGTTRDLMVKLGAEPCAPKDPRFDKTHRQMAKRRGRPPKGLKLAGEPTAADALPET